MLHRVNIDLQCGDRKEEMSKVYTIELYSRAIQQKFLNSYNESMLHENIRHYNHYHMLNHNNLLNPRQKFWFGAFVHQQCIFYLKSLRQPQRPNWIHRCFDLLFIEQIRNVAKKSVNQIDSVNHLMLEFVFKLIFNFKGFIKFPISLLFIRLTFLKNMY